MNDAIFNEKMYDEMKKFEESIKGDEKMEYRSHDAIDGGFKLF